MTEFEIENDPVEPLPVPQMVEKPVNLNGTAVADVTGDYVQLTQWPGNYPDRRWYWDCTCKHAFHSWQPGYHQCP
jgi:hypothetical protein